MKKIFSLFLAMTLAVSSISVFAESDSTSKGTQNVWREIYVSESGNDSNDGSSEHPFKTIDAAKQWVRENSDNMTGDIIVNIMPGMYFRDETLFFDSADSGKNGHNIVYRGAGDNKTVISGGKRITGFTKSAYDGIWVADAPEFDYLLQLRVNDKRRYVAKTSRQIKGVRKAAKYDTEDWYMAHPNDAKDDHYNYYNPDTPYTYDGLYVSKYDLGIYENQQDMFVYCNKDWWICTVPVERIEQDPDMADQLRVIFNPYYNAAVKNTEITPTRDFTFMNAFELLDEPGEFYFNKNTKKLYYMPEKGEDMTTAEVYGSNLEMLMYINGEDVDKKVKNITFEGITFSDTSFEFGFPAYYEQAVRIYGSNTGMYGPRGILVEYADNVNFTGNSFNNIGGSALDMRNACENCSVVGNVFYDIGENGFVAGSVNHGDFSLGGAQMSADGISDSVPEKYKNAPVDLLSLNTTKVNSSVYLTDLATEEYRYEALSFLSKPTPDDCDTKASGPRIHQTWFDKDGIASGSPHYWEDADSVIHGKKPWVSYEFVKPYALKDIFIGFNPDYVNASEMGNYTILASNDRNFENYDIIAEQKAAPDSKNFYHVDSDKKYKYVKIQSNDSKVLRITNVAISTEDIKPFVKNQRCKFITVKNNYFTRIGTDITRSIGIVVLHGEDFDVSHNDVYDIGYSGMSIGYSWALGRTTCYRMNVSYNRVDRVTQTSHDGGGIYVLGPQPGSYYTHNFISGVRLGVNGFYTDNGSSYDTITDNVIYTAEYILSPYANIEKNIYKNNYATHGNCMTQSKDLNDFEYPHITAIGFPEYDGEYDTLMNAGLEEAYKGIKTLVPHGVNNLYDHYANNAVSNKNERAGHMQSTENAMKSTFNVMAEKAKYGSGTGMLPYSEEYELKNIRSYLEGTTNSDAHMCYTKAREYEDSIINAYAKVKTLDEVIAECGDKLAYAKERIAPKDGKGTCGKYPEKAVNEFEGVYNKYKNLTADKLSISEIRRAISALNGAANKMEDARNAGLIEFVYADKALSTDIDAANKTVTLKFPIDEDISNVTLDLKVHSGAVVGRNMGGSVNLTQPITVPVYCNGNKRYTIWTIKAEFEKPVDNANIALGNWSTTTTELDRLHETDDGIVLPAWEYLMMSDAYSEKDKGGYINFMPLTKNEKNKFTVVLGASTPQGQETSSTVQKRCEIDFDNNGATFYKVVNGKRTRLDQNKQTGIKYNEKNKLEYTVENINNNAYFKVYLNGKLIFSTVAEKITFGKYFGFINRFMNIKIIKTEV